MMKNTMYKTPLHKVFMVVNLPLWYKGRLIPWTDTYPFVKDENIGNRLCYPMSFQNFVSDGQYLLFA